MQVVGWELEEAGWEVEVQVVGWEVGKAAAKAVQAHMRAAKLNGKPAGLLHGEAEDEMGEAEQVEKASPSVRTHHHLHQSPPP